MTTKTMPFFSIIIPALDEEKYLPHLLEDLSVQSFKDFEAFVVDGESDDKTVSLAKDFTNKLPSLTILSTKTRNVGHQRNLGAKKAHGTYLLFLDADDRIPSYFLEGLTYQIHRTNAKIFSGWCKADSDNKADRAIANSINLIGEAGLLLDSPVAWGGLIGIEKNTFHLNNGFDEKLNFLEDTEFVRRCYNKGATFSFFRDPQWTFSLRRFRANGTIKTLQKYALVHLKRLAQLNIDPEKDYPMGGSAFKDTTTRKFINKINSTWKNLYSKPKMAKKIQALLETLNNGN